MAVPDKYKDMCTFYKYYSGEKVAPILTIFVGGNHEASNYLQELPYGGWVAPNIYYLGYASVITIGGIRIAGVSGIFKSQHWMQGRYEKPPYNNDTIRSVYHVRNLDVFRLKQLTGSIDIFLSHDWPRGITKYGDEKALLRKKPFFRSDIESKCLGSQPNMELLEQHYPAYWFAAHLHCKFAALIPEDGGSRVTKFLALDKCLPKRKFLQVLEIQHDENIPLKISYDLEWLTILFLSNHLLSIKSGTHYMPGEYGSGRWIYTPTEEEKQKVLKKFNGDLEVPLNFTQTVEPYNPEAPKGFVEPATLQINEQTTEFCNKLGIDDPFVLLQVISGPTEKKYDMTESMAVASCDNVIESSEIFSESEDEGLCNSTFDGDNSSYTVHSLSGATLPSPKRNVDNCYINEEISSKEISEPSLEESVSTTNIESPCDSTTQGTHIEPNYDPCPPLVYDTLDDKFT
ncbi:lariat debranching enzyme isoform X2 [Cephus cinctus]|nr:lariat debranching enzyme isoform X2 [Cephus cinctus]